jgi:hypothetical protein
MVHDLRKPGDRCGLLVEALTAALSRSCPALAATEAATSQCAPPAANKQRASEACQRPDPGRKDQLQCFAAHCPEVAARAQHNQPRAASCWTGRQNQAEAAARSCNDTQPHASHTALPLTSAQQPHRRRPIESRRSGRGVCNQTEGVPMVRSRSLLLFHAAVSVHHPYHQMRRSLRPD